MVLRRDGLRTLSVFLKITKSTEILYEGGQQNDFFATATHNLKSIAELRPVSMEGILTPQNACIHKCIIHIYTHVCIYTCVYTNTSQDL